MMRRLLTRPVGYVVAVALVVVGLLNQGAAFNGASLMFLAGLILLVNVALTHSVAEDPHPGALSSSEERIRAR